MTMRPKRPAKKRGSNKNLRASAAADRVLDLTPVRMDGWLESMQQSSPHFVQLCEIVGTPFVALSVLAGVRFNAIVLNPVLPQTSLVQFEVGEGGQEQRLSLLDFRERLSLSLLDNDAPETELPEQPSADQIQRWIGVNYVLLSAVLGLELQELQIDAHDQLRVRVRQGSQSVLVSKEAFRTRIKQRVLAELEQYRNQSTPTIDLSKVALAEAALKEDAPQRVIEILGSWPNLLSILLRTPESQSMSEEDRVQLAYGVVMLAKAYQMREEDPFAEDVLRVGLQWTRESASGVPLFLELGRLCVRQGRTGEAIGVFRRALSLGGAPEEVLPLLAECYADRGRFVASQLCLNDALTAGASADALTALSARLQTSLGDPYARFEAWMKSHNG